MSSTVNQFSGRTAAFGFGSRSYTYRLVLAFVFTCFILFSVVFDHSRTGIFILALSVYLFCTDVFHRAALKDLLAGRLSFAVMVSLSVTAAFLYSVFKTFFTSPLFGLPGDLYLEGSLLAVLALWIMRREVQRREQTKVFIKKLDDFLPKAARICRNRRTFKVFAHELKLGDIILVKPGERIPCDGVVAKGASAVDESIITGNMLPTSKKKGSVIFAGTLNKADEIYIEVTGLLSTSVVMDIINAIKNSEINRAPGACLLDRAAKFYIPLALLAAAGVFVWLAHANGYQNLFYYSGAFWLVLALACTPGFVFAAWMGYSFAYAGAASHKIILQNVDALNQLAQADTVFFDKTGTLTHGELRVEGVFAETAAQLKQMLESVASAEQMVDGPFAKAVNLYAKQHNVKLRKVVSFDVLPGLGVVANCGRDKIVCGRETWLREMGIETQVEMFSGDKPLICVAKNGKFLGHLTLSDTLRPGAADAVRFLQHKDKELVLISGDNELSVSSIAKQVGIEKMSYNVLPQTKAEIINNMRGAGHKVVMVGDGFNDIIALLRSDASLVFFSGRNLYNNWVDIIIKRNDLYALIDLFKINKKLKRVIRWNFLLAFVGGVGLAFYVLFGVQGRLAWYMVPGGLALGLGIVFLNSARLLRIR